MNHFDPHNIDHIEAYAHLCKTGVWPEEHDIVDRYTNPVWVISIQAQMAMAWVGAMNRSKATMIDLKNKLDEAWCGNDS